jgi:hypothetical protein
MRRNSDDSEKPSYGACRSSPDLSGDEITLHRFSYDRVLPGVLDAIVCADIVGKAMQEDA